MLRIVVTFAPVAALLSLAPGPATALVVRNAAIGGRRHAFLTTAGNSIGILAWGCFAAVGVAAVVATSAHAFTAVKLVGAVVLIALGVQSIRGRREAAETRPRRTPLRDGLVTSLAGPGLAACGGALAPRFGRRGTPARPGALVMGGVSVRSGLGWYPHRGALVARAKPACGEGRWRRRVERVTGAVLV